MSITLFSSIGWAIEKQTVSSGGGLTGPVLVSAVSTDPNTVRLTFDRRLMLEYRQSGIYRALTLDLSSFSIAKVSDATPLEVVRTIWIDDTHIDLATANQQAESYQLTCLAGGVMDFQGNTITLQTATFTGQQRVNYTTPSDIRLFSSGYAGMQDDLASDFYPDLTAPNLQNLDPYSGETEVQGYKTVVLEIVDADTGVSPSSVVIRFNGVDVWVGDTSQPGYAVTKTAITHGFRYSIVPAVWLPSYSTIAVYVLASDLAVIPNILETTYTFETKDYVSPVIDSNTPIGAGVSETTHVQFSTKDVGGIGIDLETIQATIGGTAAVTNGIPVNDWALLSTVTPNVFGGYDFDLVKSTGAFPTYSLYAVHVAVSDLESPPNTNTLDWSFRVRDYEGPIVHPVLPVPDQEDVPGNTNIVVQVTDVDSIVSGSLRVRVNRGAGFVVAYQQGDDPPFKTGYNGPDSVVDLIANGYRVTIDPTTDFGYSEFISIEVSAADPSGNPESLG